MKHKFIGLFFLTICFIFLIFGIVFAQAGVELPEIKGPHFQVYQDLRIEIAGIKRMNEYQSYWHNSERPRGKKLIADPGFEIALVQINTKRLGDNPGISVNSLYLFDSKGREYEARTRTFFLGTRAESGTASKEHVYELPVQVPKGTQISAVQLRQFIVKETQPFVVHQKISFDVREFAW
jgi:hypothetical protein